MCVRRYTRSSEYLPPDPSFPFVEPTTPVSSGQTYPAEPSPLEQQQGASSPESGAHRPTNITDFRQSAFVPEMPTASAPTPAQSERADTSMSELVADRKRIIAELRKQLDFTRAISQNLGEGIIALDGEDCVTFMNPAAEHMLGWTEDELLGRQLHEVLHFDEPDETEEHRHLCELRTMLRLGQRGTCEHNAFTCKSGSVVPVAFEFSPFAPETELAGGVVAFRDITEQLRTEQERLNLLARERQARADAEAAQRRLAFLAEASVVLSSSLDDAVTLDALAHLTVPKLADCCLLAVPQGDGTVTYLAADAPQEGQPFTLSPTAPATDDDVYKRLQHLLADGLPERRPVLPGEGTNLGTADVQMPADLRSSIGVPLLARDRRLGAMMLYRAGEATPYTDDDLALVEALAQRAALAMENALLYRETRNALDHRDAFLGIASHELKTPLTSLKVATQLTIRRLKGQADTTTQYAKRMESAISRMERLVSDLLEVSRIQSGKLELRPLPLDLSALCLQVAEEIGAVSGRNITVESPRQPLQIFGDSDRLQQVLYNLLTNALKYSEPETPITLRATCERGAARVTVQDTGVGIPAEDIPHLFERFYRAPDVAVQNGSQVGLGLGLFISREVIEHHGGRIWLESVPGQGTSATFTLPLA